MIIRRERRAVGSTTRQSCLAATTPLSSSRSLAARALRVPLRRSRVDGVDLQVTRTEVRPFELRAALHQPADQRAPSMPIAERVARIMELRNEKRREDGGGWTEGLAAELATLTTTPVPMALDARVTRIVELRDVTAARSVASADAWARIRRETDLCGLNSAALGELKGLGQPPPEAFDVVRAALYLRAPEGADYQQIDASCTTWKKCKQVLGDVNGFLKTCRDLDIRHLPAANVEAVRPLVALEWFNFEGVKAKMSAAAGLADWVENVVVAYDLYQELGHVLHPDEVADVENRSMCTSYPRPRPCPCPFPCPCPCRARSVTVRQAVAIELELLMTPPRARAAPATRLAELAAARSALLAESRALRRSYERALDEIDVASVQKLKSLKRAPAVVDDVLVAVLYLMEKHESLVAGLDTSWSRAQGAMTPPAKFLTVLRHLDVERIPAASVAAVRPLLALEHFTVMAASKTSSFGAGALVSWVLRTVEYYDALHGSASKELRRKLAAVSAELEFLSTPPPSPPPRPLDFSGAALPLREEGVIAADRATDAQLSTWAAREAKWGAGGSMPAAARARKLRRWTNRVRARAAVPKWAAAPRAGFVIDFNEHGVAFIGHKLGAERRAADAAAKRAAHEARAQQAVDSQWVVWPMDRRWGEPGWGTSSVRLQAGRRRLMFLAGHGQRQPGAWRQLAASPSAACRLLAQHERTAGRDVRAAVAASRAAKELRARAAEARRSLAPSSHAASTEESPDAARPAASDDAKGATDLAHSEEMHPDDWDPAHASGGGVQAAGAAESGEETWTVSKWVASLGLHEAIAAAIQPLLPDNGGDDAFTHLAERLARADLEAALATARLDGLTEPLWAALGALKAQTASTGAAYRLPRGRIPALGRR